MARIPLAVPVVTLVACLAVAACSPAAPTPAPTQLPAAPPKAAEPAKPQAAPTAAAAAPAVQPAATPAAAPAPQPTAAPAKKIDYPTKGKPISIIVPYPAGGGTDVAARIMATFLEKDLGAPFEVVNVSGAGGQVGMAQMAKAKPDGYTIGYQTLPDNIAVYFDPERKSTYFRKDLLGIAQHVVDPGIIVAGLHTKYKTMKDFIDDAKAKPEGVKVGVSGILGAAHLSALQLQVQTGAKFAVVIFDGATPRNAALLGGHIDVSLSYGSQELSNFKGNAHRVLGVTQEGSRFYPGVPTLESQGYNLVLFSSKTVVAPAGMAPEMVDVLGQAIKRVVATPDHNTKIEELGFIAAYQDAAQFNRAWDKMETDIKPLMSLPR